jgi:hypothetical protein
MGPPQAVDEDTDMQDATKSSETRVRTAKAVGTAGRLTFPDEPSNKKGRSCQGRGGVAGR